MEGEVLPEGWELVPLLDLGELIRGVTYAKNDASDSPFSGSVPVLRANNIQDRHFELDGLVYVPSELVSPVQIIAKGDVVIATSSGSIAVVGKAAQAQEDLGAGFGAFCGLIRPSREISPGYFGHFFSSEHYRSSVSAMARGVNINNLKKSHFESLCLPLAPLDEQRRIATKLDATLADVDACRQRLDGVAAILKRFRQAVLAAATSGELTREWREDNPIDEDTGDNEVASLIEKWISSQLRGKAKIPAEPDLRCWTTEIPQSWHLGSVSMFAECLDSQRIPVKKDKRNAVQGTYPYYGANGIVDMVDEYIFDGELVLVTEDETFYGREKPIAYRSSGKCWVNNHAHVLRPEDAVAADYLCYCLMHYPVLPWLTGTTGRAKLTQGVLNSLPVAIPPRIEMERIVSRVQELFSLADQLEAKLTDARKIVDRLTPALLAKAFRGELVPQDPSEEPASVLLERIRAARQEEAAAGKPLRRGRRKSAAHSEQTPLPAAPAPPDLLAQLLQECGALSERALLAASELEPGRFRRQLALEVEAGNIREELEGGQQVLMVAGKS